jgi:hypothetical protein
MSENFAVFVNGLDTLSAFDEVPENIARAARQAINRTVERARAAAAREIRRQVSFPAQYLSGNQGRLATTKKASGTDFEGIVTGRSRPTSLARFTTGEASRRGIKVTVEPGLARYLPKAFFIRLRAGSADIETRSNLGLAIRLPEGKVPSGAYRPKLIGTGLWLLYGPDVAQVFKTVAEDVSPESLDFLENEFARLLELQ